MVASNVQWTDVPARIEGLVAKYAADAQKLVDNEPFNPYERYIDTPEVGRIYLCKQANVVQTATSLYGGAQKLLGGPNPLTAALVTGTLGAGLGYGGGWLAEKLFPRKFVRRGILPRNLAIAMGALGAGTAGYAYGRPNVKALGWKGLLHSGAYGTPQDQQEFLAGMNKQQSAHNSQGDYITSALKQAEVDYGVKFEFDVDFEKTAISAGGAFVPQIPVDMFNRAVLNDPFTPQPIQAATTGLTSAASIGHGGAQLVSPFDVGRIAMGMGSGAVSGMLVGKTLGALAGLTPEAQEGIQRAGIWAGLLTNVVPMAFG